MLKAFADAEQSPVPAVRKTSVRAESDGAIVVDERRTAGTGYREYAVAVVSTIRNERRGLERAR